MDYSNFKDLDAKKPVPSSQAFELLGTNFFFVALAPALASASVKHRREELNQKTALHVNPFFKKDVTFFPDSLFDLYLQAFRSKHLFNN